MSRKNDASLKATLRARPIAATEFLRKVFPESPDIRAANAAIWVWRTIFRGVDRRPAMIPLVWHFTRRVNFKMAPCWRGSSWQRPWTRLERESGTSIFFAGAPSMTLLISLTIGASQVGTIVGVTEEYACPCLSGAGRFVLPRTCRSLLVLALIAVPPAWQSRPWPRLKRIRQFLLYSCANAH